MKSVNALLVVLFVVLQYELWFAPGGMAQALHLQHVADAQKAQLSTLQEKNKVILADVDDLKRGGEAIEERARNELGMIKQGETFYQLAE